ncbi:TIGR03085 family metal-binding protein [Kitasatospora mediocidica]|uniref:TIGR03085 family metal-binding protein n=1 Tax=Kitasatospora mediocidica TaxID=58352 RepID=UPI00055CF8A3|nr:TIGR03085 family metal-binding protein [Kitasatospora mediocidica]
MSNHARTERHRLADLLAAAGPQAPTLCAGWRTRELAAHLLLRERRPDAGPGIQLRQFAGWTKRVQDGYARRPYEQLVRDFRAGPPRLSFFALPGADEAANTVEYFVHAEDVRRAGDWEPRPLAAEFEEALWKRLPLLARFEAGRRTPVRLLLRRPDGRFLTVRPREPLTVQVSGEPSELLLFAFGRGAQARLTVQGSAEAVTALGARLPLPADSQGD